MFEQFAREARNNQAKSDDILKELADLNRTLMEDNIHAKESRERSYKSIQKQLAILNTLVNTLKSDTRDGQSNDGKLPDHVSDIMTEKLDEAAHTTDSRDANEFHDQVPLKLDKLQQAHDVELQPYEIQRKIRTMTHMSNNQVDQDLRRASLMPKNKMITTNGSAYSFRSSIIETEDIRHENILQNQPTTNSDEEPSDKSLSRDVKHHISCLTLESWPNLKDHPFDPGPTKHLTQHKDFENPPLPCPKKVWPCNTHLTTAKLIENLENQGIVGAIHVLAGEATEKITTMPPSNPDYLVLDCYTSNKHDDVDNPDLVSTRGRNTSTSLNDTANLISGFEKEEKEFIHPELMWDDSSHLLPPHPDSTTFPISNQEANPYKPSSKRAWSLEDRLPHIREWQTFDALTSEQNSHPDILSMQNKDAFEDKNLDETNEKPWKVVIVHEKSEVDTLIDPPHLEKNSKAPLLPSASQKGRNQKEEELTILKQNPRKKLTLGNMWLQDAKHGSCNRPPRKPPWMNEDDSFHQILGKRRTE
jgi:hypothetical protein